MDCESKAFKKIERTYTITSKELKMILGIKGEIINMGLQEGRSPKDIELGVSADNDKWYIDSCEVNDV